MVILLSDIQCFYRLLDLCLIVILVDVKILKSYRQRLSKPHLYYNTGSPARFSLISLRQPAIEVDPQLSGARLKGIGALAVVLQPDRPSC